MEPPAADRAAGGLPRIAATPATSGRQGIYEVLVNSRRCRRRSRHSWIPRKFARSRWARACVPCGSAAPRGWPRGRDDDRGGHARRAPAGRLSPTPDALTSDQPSHRRLADALAAEASAPGSIFWNALGPRRWRTAGGAVPRDARHRIAAAPGAGLQPFRRPICCGAEPRVAAGSACQRAVDSSPLPESRISRAALQQHARRRRARSSPTVLRHYRQRHMLRIVWRDFCRLADTLETVRDTSLLAEATHRRGAGVLPGRTAGALWRAARARQRRAAAA